ncbi:MAG: phosphoribosylanthranilate isomerase [Gemmatimonadetes bacterium]|nr:phosphoribosylanthranilate isomerase [Gemmatimonadota bacterium]
MRHHTWIKMCGITRLEDAIAAAEAGADALGFVFAESPRRIDPKKAFALIHGIPSHVLRFAVVVDESPAEIADILANTEIDRVQIHGFEEPTVHELMPTRTVKAFRARNHDVVREIEESAAPFFFLDTWRQHAAGGTGETFDWEIAKRARSLGRMVLAGGLTPENVGEAIREVGPFGVDVSSGIEVSPGIKDPAKIRAFVDAVRAADAERARATSPAG